MPKPPDLWLPKRRRWSSWAIVLSLGLHVLLLFVKIHPWLVPPRRPPPAIVVLLPAPSQGQPQAVDVQFEVPGGAARQGRSTGVVPREEIAPTPTPETPSPEVIAAPPPVAPTVLPAPDSGRLVAPSRDRNYHIGPSLGEGRLWVRPLPAPPREIAEALTRTHLQLVDSAVSAIVQQYIDSVLNAPSEPGAALPSWTTKILGKTFGIDSKYIYIAGLKIPSAVLALLPIKGGGMTLEYSKANKLALIREDLSFAMQRSATLDDFKRAVRELRAERERLRQLEQNQRKGATPDSARKDPPKPIPPSR